MDDLKNQQELLKGKQRRSLLVDRAQIPVIKASSWLGPRKAKCGGSAMDYFRSRASRHSPRSSGRAAMDYYQPALSLSSGDRLSM